MTKIKIAFLFGLSVLTIVNCTNPKTAQPVAETIDSIKISKSDYERLVGSFEDAVTIMDSINLSTGIKIKLSDRDSFVQSLRHLKEHVESTGKKVSVLQRNLKQARTEAEAYLMISDAYKSELEMKDEQILQLLDSVTVVQGFSQSDRVEIMSRNN